MNRYSSVSKVYSEKTRVLSRTGVGTFLFTTASRSTLKPTLNHRVPHILPRL